MAKLQDAGHKLILDAAQLWKERCLKDGVSIFSDQPLWTTSNFASLHEAFFGNLIQDSDRTFYEKLEEQLNSYSPQIKQLTAEMIWFMMLFPAGVSGDRKRADVSEIWGWSGESLPTDHALLGSVLDKGIGRAGVAYHTLRWREFGLFIEVMLQFRQLADVRQANLLNDPWDFADWIDSETPSTNRPFRHILLYLLFPDHFERSGNTRHKRAIVYGLAGKLGSSLSAGEVTKLSRLELDQMILRIRKRIEDSYPDSEIDFYKEPAASLYSPKFPPPSGRVLAKYPKPPDTVDLLDVNSASAVANILTNDPNVLRLVLETFASAIKLANAESPHRWALTLSRHRLSLNVGRLLVVGIRRGCLFLSARTEFALKSSPEAEEVLARLKSEPFSSVSGINFYTVSEPEIEKALPILRSGLAAAISAATQTQRRAIGWKKHSPGVLDFIDKELGIELPRPAHQSGGAGGVPEAVVVDTPLLGFRATELDLDALMSDVANGDIGLPDIQRPFVWTAAKVRDLFDSMYRGYPVGYLLFWETMAEQKNARVIGIDRKAFGMAKRLIVDGQQRLTSLYAVMRGQQVLTSDYERTKIDIAFRPRDGRFEVADAAVRRDPEYISSISDVFSDGRSSYSLIKDFLKALTEKRELTERDTEIIEKNLERLFRLKNYRFSVLEISADLEEEAVADIFVRINSEGVKLNQADFILTLLSVIWEEGRMQLESFARSAKLPSSQAGRSSPFNHLIAPSPDQMLRVSVASAFGRARLRSVYQLLRGKDPDTGAVVPERRAEQLQLLKAAQEGVLDVNNWHRFIGCITGSGFRLAEQISSQNALLTAYALYLHGLSIPDLNAAQLDRLIGRWFWMAILTSRFTGAPETVMEQELGRVRPTTTARAYEEAISRAIAAELTNDYWNVTLPMELETSSSRAPGWSAFVASQLRLEAPVLFSDKKLWVLLDPLTRGKRRAFEAHHLFPKAWLAGRGITERKVVNQIANLALLEWPANMKAGSRSPSEYVSDLCGHIEDGNWERMCRLHALPAGWEDMLYDEFLQKRRELMAGVIRRGFESLGGQSSGDIDDTSDGSETEQTVWREIASLEKELRALVQTKFIGAWGSSADARIAKLLGEKGMETVSRNQEKYRRQYKYTAAPHGDDIVDFLYLGQLVELIKSGDSWPLFKEPFRDKRQLEDMIAAIIPVRNDAAHFRTVPPNELDRCRIAVNDLRQIIKRL